MQTFLPYANFRTSAESLDYRRLGKQRVETLQMLRALEPDSTSGWRNHPATRMWAGFEYQLAKYGITMCGVWIERGYNDTTRPKLIAYRELHRDGNRGLPPWFGLDQFHEAHRAMLYAKDPQFYAKYEGTFSPDITDYWWPTKEAA